MTLTRLTDIPNDLLRLIEPATKSGAAIFAQYNGHALGQVKKAHIMRDMYRLYIESDHGSGEHRYSKEEASNIYLAISY